MLLAYADLVICFNCLFTWFDSADFLIGLSRSGFSFFVLLQVFVALAFISHIRSAFTDPGKTPKLDPVGEEIKFCELCNQYKPPRSHHCRKCEVCIHRMDHHCIWINNCVGFCNHKYFILFLLYVLLSAIVGVLIILISGYLFLVNQAEFVQWKVFLVLLAGFECVLFMIFTGDYLLEQLSLLKNGQNTIEKLHRKYGEDLGRLENLKQILGPTPWLWFFPLPPPVHCNFHEPLYTFSEMMLEKGKKLRFTSVVPEYNLIE